MSLFLITKIISFVLLAVAVVVLVLMRKRVKAENKTLTDMMDASGIGMVLFDQDDKIAHLNVHAERFLPELTAHSREMTFSAFMDFVFDRAKEGEEGLSHSIQGEFEKSQQSGFYDVIETCDGRLCLVEIGKTTSGNHIVLLTDLSARKQQEERVSRLTRSNFELEQAVQAMGSGIVICNALSGEHNILYANKAFCDIVALPLEEVVGQKLLTWLKSFCDEDQYKKILSCIRGNDSCDVDVLIAKLKNKEIWFNIKITPITKGEGQVVESFLAIFTDISETKAREATLMQSQKLEALGQLAAGIAHDFNNILSIVDGYAQIAKRYLDDPEKISDYLDKIDQSSKRGAALTKQMLIFSRHKIMEDKVIDMVETIHDQEPLLRSILSGNVSFTISEQSKALPVICAKDAMEQVFMNLVINARDAMPQGGSIEVEMGVAEPGQLPEDMENKDREGGYSYLRVRDDGEGIDEKTIKKIFDPFFTTKEQGKGTGLGLSMIYGRVKEIGGFIDVSSTKGRGATFEIFFPTSDKEPDKVVEGSKSDVESIRLKGYTVLVAEDEAELLALVVDMLEKMGMTVISASNGDEALMKQDDFEGQIDLLLTDVVMPELDGVKLAELFHSLRPDAKIIFMSGYPAMERGAMHNAVNLPKHAEFLAKPFDYEQLARIIYLKLSDNDGEGRKKDEAMAAYWDTND